jgi:hypothetical protein
MTDFYNSYETYIETITEKGNFVIIIEADTNTPVDTAAESPIEQNIVGEHGMKVLRR